MGSSCINNENNNNYNIQQKNQIINLFGCTDETHDSLKYISNYNQLEYIATKQKITDYNNNINNNNNKQKITISEPSIILSLPVITEDINYEILPIRKSDKEEQILNKLYNILEEKDTKIERKEGIIKYKNGEKYIGELDKENKKNGRGIKIFNNNNIYYGYWEDNKMNGIGKMIKFNQKLDDLNIIFNDNLIPFYYGEWKNNLEDGNGEEIWMDNSTYKGEYKEGFKHGYGILSLPDGTQFDGEFSHGKIEGKGTIKYNDGRIYDGNWRNNKMNGEGIFEWPDGRSYKGNYLNNYKSGYGEFTWPDGKIYKGMWINGKQNGEGKLYSKKYDIWITGIWDNGKRIKGNEEW
jgi:hypothetical protein